MVRLVGKIDGVEISFDFTPPNQYIAILPKRLNGRYVVQLKALDEAGNETNYIDVYMFIDFQQMSFKVINDPFRFDTHDGTLGFIEVDEDFEEASMDSDYGYNKLSTMYTFKELMLE